VKDFDRFPFFHKKVSLQNKGFAKPVKNGSQAANERFFAFPEIRIIY
jgi:hypothetical protein